MAANRAVQRTLVVGGSGFVGSAICKACIARGWSVVSLSRNGKARESREPWMDKVEWIKGDVFDRGTLKTILPEVTSVIHTLGVLLETDYKSKGLSSLASGIAMGISDNISRSGQRDHGNPLATSSASREAEAQGYGLYEKINRDSAITVLKAYLETTPRSSDNELLQNPFVYISAEDIFRPFIPSRYISSKREAEESIVLLSQVAQQQHSAFDADTGKHSSRLIRPILLRPSLIYHPTIRPPSALPASLLKVSARLQNILPTAFRAQSLSGLFSSALAPSNASAPASVSSHSPQLPSAASSVANLLSIPPIHVDTVAEAACRAIENQNVSGVLGVSQMQNLVKGQGFRPVAYSKDMPSPQATTPPS